MSIAAKCGKARPGRQKSYIQPIDLPLFDAILLECELGEKLRFF